MAQNPPPRRGGAGVLAAVVLIVAALLVFAPSLVSTWLGGVIGEVWAAALGAITALLSGLFGAELLLFARL
jgi:hypothetical protein